MKDFFDKSGWNFVMFTSEDGVINEQPLNINLNARTITVPAAVASCAGVQKDQLAEMLIFETDRFFDYMDLSNTNIYVQWKNANGEGDTRVTMIDFTSKPGKMLFAWPLTHDVTSVAGPVRFSVRFFRLNDAKKVIYSLNTQEASLTIKPALAADLNDLLVEPVRAGLFDDVILNSQNAEKGRAMPLAPRFDAPGRDISLLTTDDNGKYVITNLNKVDNKYVANLVRDTVTFCAKAYAADLGNIDYEWVYIADSLDENGNPITVTYKYAASDEDNDLVENIYIPLSEDRLTALRAEGAKPEANARYFTKLTDEENIPAYLPYALTGENFPIAEDTVLYELYTTFTVAAEGTVVGKYYASAVNHIGAMSTENTPVRSSECILPGPQEIQLESDLETSRIITKTVEDDSVTLGNNVLSITLPENVYNADIVYTWKKKTSPEADFDDLEVNSNSITVTDLGWYKVDVVSTLNRKETTPKESQVCKVTFAPEAPTITNTSGDDRYHLVSTSEPQVLSVSAQLAENADNPLYSEGFDYTWYIARNSELRPLTAADANIAVASGNTLTVKYVANLGAVSFNCRAENKLNGMKASSDFLDVPFYITFG